MRNGNFILVAVDGTRYEHSIESGSPLSLPEFNFPESTAADRRCVELPLARPAEIAF